MKEADIKHERSIKVEGARIVERGHELGGLDWSIDYLNKKAKTKIQKKYSAAVIKEAIKEANRPKSKRRKWQQI